MLSLKQSLSFREQGQFHKSKMTLWNFLQNNTTNGYRNFRWGEMASISQIFDALSQGVLSKEKDALFMKHSLTIQCSESAHHQHNRTTTNSLYFLHNSCMNIMDISNSAYDPVNVVEKHLNRKQSISQHLCTQKDENGTNICNGNLLYTSKLLNASFFLPVELDKDENGPVQPKLSGKLDFNFGNQTYELTAIIYQHNNQFWCEKRVLHSGFKKGWYISNDLQNNGQEPYVSKRPQVSDPPYMHILLFEKSPQKTSNKRKQPISKDDPPSAKKARQQPSTSS